jgi:hypothetical protein
LNYRWKNAYDYSIIYLNITQSVTTGVMLILLNNIELDVKTKCIEESKTQAKIAEEVGTTPGYISRIVNSKEQIVNKTFLGMMESLCYNVRLTYEKREDLYLI